MRFFLVSPEAEEVSALVSALAHQQSRAESEAENAAAGGSDDEDFIGMNKDPFFGKLKRTFTSSRYHVIMIIPNYNKNLNFAKNLKLIIS